MQVEFEAVCGPSVHDILGRHRRPFIINVNALDRLSITLYRVPFRRYRPLIQVAVKLRSRPKRWFLAPRCVGAGIPRILDMRFQIAVTSEHVTDFGWVPFSELGD